MKCVLAPNGMPSNVYNGLHQYMILKGLDVQYADNLAVKNWLHATKEELLQQYPEMPLDANGEPMLFFAANNIKNSLNSIVGRPDNLQYQFKVVDLISKNIDKVNKLWQQLAGTNIFWDKIQKDYQIPKSQIELLKNSNGKNIEEKLISFINNYSYTIEINTARTNEQKISNDVSSFVLDDFHYSVYDGNYMKRRIINGSIDWEEKGLIRITKNEYDSANKQLGFGNSTDFYSNVTVPGGTNYIEQELVTPNITSSIKPHAKFATANNIGWIRSDELINMYADRSIDLREKMWNSYKEEGWPTDDIKTRRILELQSDLFQKGRGKDDLIGGTTDKKDDFKDEYKSYYIGNVQYVADIYEQRYLKLEPGYSGQLITKEEFERNIPRKKDTNENQFLQLLNKDNNWVTFFVNSIIQDSVKKGYEKVLFPTGDTAFKIQSGGKTMEDFIKAKEDAIKNNEEYLSFIKDVSKIGDTHQYRNRSGKITIETIEDEIDLNETISSREATIRENIQLKKELEDAKKGVSGLFSTAKFYQTTVFNILNKQGSNPVLITDEYGNTWYEISLDNIEFESRNLAPLALDNSIKPGVAELFESNPELASIGTPEQYSQYLNTIFPNSQVNDIVYHGQPIISKTIALNRLNAIQKLKESKAYQNIENNPKKVQKQIDAILKKYPDNPIIETFDKSKIGSQSNSGITNGFYFTSNKNVANWNSSNRILSVLLNIKEGIQRIDYKGDKIDLKHLKENVDKFSNLEGYDAVIFENVIDSLQEEESKLGNTYVVFEPEQIHILGNKNDLNQFAQFVNQNFNTSNDGINITNDMAIVSENVEKWKPVFLKSYPEFLTDEETISNNYVNLDTNSGTNGFIHLNQQGSLIGNVPIQNEVSALVNPLPVKYQRIKQNPSSRAELTTFADFMSRKMGIKYVIISEDQARQINPGYNNEPGFFVGNQAYLVEGVAGKMTALHEIFGHPIVELLEQTNPELLNALFSQIPEETINEIKRLYPEEVIDGELSYTGMKEALIRTFENEAQGKLQGPEKSALRNLIDNIWMMLKRLFKQYTGVDGFGRYTTIKDIVDLAFNGSVFNTEFIESSQVKYSRIDNAKDMSATLANKFGTFTMQEVDGVDTYSNSALTTMVYKRLTEVMNINFTNDVFGGTTEERAKNRAKQIFTQRDAIFETSDTSMATGKVKYDDKFLTFDEVADLFLIEFNTKLRYGIYAHKLMEYYFTDDPNKIDEINQALVELTNEKVVNGKVVAKGVEANYFNFITRIGLTKDDIASNDIPAKASKNRNAVLSRLNIQLLNGDIVLSEFIMGSNKLGIATTADLLVINPDGAIRLIDFKTGRLDSDEHYATTIMPYMRQNPLTSMSTAVVTKQNIYGISLMLRAFIIKENIPDARFSDLALFNISPSNGPDGLTRNPDELPWEEYLYAIESWIKDKYPADLYQQYKDAGMFEFETYATPGFKFRDFLVKNASADESTLQEQIIKLSGQLQLLENTNGSESVKAKVREARDKAVAAFLDTRRTDSLTMNVWTKNEPLPSNLLTGFRNRYDFSKVPLMQMIIDFESEAANKAIAKVDRIKLEHDKLMDAVIEDFKRIDPAIRTKLKTGSNRFYGIDIYKGDGTGVFDFAYVPVMREGVNQLGWITPNHPNWSKLTAPQKAYMEFINSKMRQAYKSASQDVAMLDRNGKPSTKAKLINKEFLEDGFLPFVPPLPDENPRIKNTWEALTNKLSSMNPFALTTTLNSIGSKPHPGMPIRFLNTSTEIKENKMHSLHVEHMFMSFMQNLYLAEELEPVLAASQGLIGYLETLGKDENFNYVHQTTIQALSTFTNMNITGRNKVGDDMIKVGRMISGKEVKSLNVTKLVTTVKNFTTYGSMFANPVLASANAVMIGSLNFKSAAINSAMVGLQKQLGIDVDDIDFTFEDMAWAHKEYAKIQTLIATGDKEGLEENKIWRMMKAWRIFPDDYWFQGSSNKDYNVKRNVNMTAEMMMTFHLLGENYGVITTFAAVAHKMKVKKGNQTKSLLDAYDIISEKLPSGVTIKTLKWNFGVRGVIAPKGSQNIKDPVVTKITGLTSKEIDYFKRVIGRIHGDYRKNERSGHEAHAVGQYFLQFKKYMLRQARNMFEGRRLDSALGQYEQVVDPVTKAPILLKFKDPETGLEMEESYIEWSSRVTEGRYTTIFLTLMSWLGHSNYALLQRIGKELGVEVPNADLYRLENLSTDQIRNILNVGADLTIMLMGVMIKHSAFDDDEQNDKNPWFIRYTRYMEDMTEGANIVDTLRGMKNPFPLTTRAYNIVNFGSEFIGSVLSGDRTENGDYRGLNSLMNNLPFTNSYRQLQRFSGE